MAMGHCDPSFHARTRGVEMKVAVLGAGLVERGVVIERTAEET